MPKKTGGSGEGKVFRGNDYIIAHWQTFCTYNAIQANEVIYQGVLTW